MGLEGRSQILTRFSTVGLRLVPLKTHHMLISRDIERQRNNAPQFALKMHGVSKLIPCDARRTAQIAPHGPI